MTQYEKTLSKIAPVFYKTLQYEEYFETHLDLNIPYLEHAEVPEVDYLYLPTKNVYFYYIIDKIPIYLSKGNTVAYDLITLTAKDKMPIHGDANLISFIISLIINKFSFENENIMAVSFTVYISLKPLFIALVGRDMYDTIRQNIK